MTQLSNIFVCIVVLFSLSICIVSEPTNVFGKLKHGLHMASKFLGLEKASVGVAQLVSDAFNKEPKKGKTEQGSNIFSGFLRILGFDAKKIGAIAVNAIIFFAQMISSSLTATPPSQLTHARNIKDESPLDWLMNSSKVMNVFSYATDKDLPEHIVNYIKERSLDEETDCIQLLVCKSSPIVWGMQKAVEARKNGTKNGLAGMFKHLPAVEDIAKYGDQCEKKHPFCFIDV